MADALIDSNVLFGFRSARDQWHEVASAIVHGMDSGNLPRGRVTNYSLPEVLNPIQKASSYTHAVETLDFVTESSGFQIELLPSVDFTRGRALYRSNHGVELTDCILVAYMQRAGLKYIYSFDDDFDRFETITRLSTPDNPYT